MTIPGTDLPANGANPWYAPFVSAWESLVGKVKDHDDLVTTGRLSESELNATYVRFLDQDGEPLPPGSLVTITVNTTTGDIDDITFEEV